MTNPNMTKNPILMLAIGWGAPFGGATIGGILAGITGLGFLSTLFWLAGAIVAGHFLKKLVEELKAVAGDTELNPTLMYIPGLNQIMCFLHAHGLMEKARRARGIAGEPKAKWMYLILPWYAISADLNGQ